VVDRTGVKALYAWSWDYYMFGGRDSEFHALNPNPSTTYPLSVAAWHDEGLEKIGLRLTPTTVPLENIVIDQLNRTPTEN